MYSSGRHLVLVLAALAFVAAVLGLLRSQAGPRAQAGEPLALLPENPRYFLFRGRPTVLVASATKAGRWPLRGARSRTSSIPG